MLVVNNVNCNRSWATDYKELKVVLWKSIAFKLACCHNAILALNGSCSFSLPFETPVNASSHMGAVNFAHKVLQRKAGALMEKQTIEMLYLLQLLKVNLV